MSPHLPRSMAVGRSNFLKPSSAHQQCFVEKPRPGQGDPSWLTSPPAQQTLPHPHLRAPSPAVSPSQGVLKSNRGKSIEVSSSTARQNLGFLQNPNFLQQPAAIKQSTRRSASSYQRGPSAAPNAFQTDAVTGRYHVYKPPLQDVGRQSRGSLSTSPEYVDVGSSDEDDEEELPKVQSSIVVRAVQQEREQPLGGDEEDDDEDTEEEEEEEEDSDEDDRQVPARGNEDDVPVYSQASTASGGFVMRHTQRPDQRLQIPGKKNVEGSTTWLNQSEQYYTFRRQHVFEVPVQRIIEPTSTMCYRKMNLQHVQSLMKEICDNPGQHPQTADVIAWHPFKNEPLTFVANQREAFRSAIPGLIFCAVSGQHSTQAVNNLILQSHEPGNQSLEKIVAPLLVRKCRILNGNTPKQILVEISLRNNSMNKIVSKFNSPFLDTIEHARNQYKDIGSPKKPNVKETGEKKKLKEFEV